MFDRLDLTSVSDASPSFSQPDPALFLPTPEDIISLKSELEILAN